MKISPAVLPLLFMFPLLLMQSCNRAEERQERKYIVGTARQTIDSTVRAISKPARADLSETKAPPSEQASVQNGAVHKKNNSVSTQDDEIDELLKPAESR